MLSDKPLTYNPWPLGNVPQELQRPELSQLKKAGYEFDDARTVIDIFEKKVAEFAGSKYAVAVDCCTHAIQLSLLYLRSKDKLPSVITLPKNTYISIPQMLVQNNIWPTLITSKWSGLYGLGNTNVCDGAVRWKAGMYEKGIFHCLSFQIKKRIPIGRGGMILTNDEQAYNWLKLARYDGRDMSLPYDHPEHIKMIGYHYYMTPEDAARGILLMDQIKEEGDSANWTNYPDVSKYFK